MHENETSMYDNFILISTYENEYIAPKCPGMTLSTQTFPWDIGHYTISCIKILIYESFWGNLSIFMHGNTIFENCIDIFIYGSYMHEHFIFMLRYFRAWIFLQLLNLIETFGLYLYVRNLYKWYTFKPDGETTSEQETKTAQNPPREITLYLPSA